MCVCVCVFLSLSLCVCVSCMQDDIVTLCYPVVGVHDCVTKKEGRKVCLQNNLPTKD